MNDIITNGTEIKQRIVSEINNSKQIVYIAMAFFTDRDIANAIIGARSRNVSIDIILSSNAQNETVKQMFREANINVHAFDTGDERGMMHHKFCLIDNKITINGSYNYSYNASNNNVENIHISDDYSIFKQFLQEFEKLKYNIDNSIDVNTTIQIPETKTQQVQPINIIDTFSQQLHNLVYSSAQINTEEYKKKGFETSNESKGNIDIFRAEYNNINEEIKTYATDEGLNSKKNTLITNIVAAFESTKTNLETEKQDKISIEKRNNELEKRQIADKTVNLKQEKSIFESGNQNTGEKGLLQINKEIEKNKLERRILEQSFVVKKFWSVGTSLVVLGLGIIALYLSIFFSSAIYKVFFELNSIQDSLQAGLTPSMPQLVDANAILKIFSQQGVLFGFIATIFFIFPVLLSNLKILGSTKKWVNSLSFIAGLFVFDILVSTMVTFNTDEIKALLKGQNSTIEIWEVVKHVEFWLIFVFGMFPLIITHFLIDNIINAYNKSRREIVDSEKDRKIQFLDEEMIEFNADKESLTIKVKEKEDLINENNKSVLHLETEFNSILNQIENKYTELLKQIKSIFDALNAKIVSGRIFTDVIFDSVITAYKSGFIEYLPKFYASNEVANRVLAIEQTT
jgi:hypothetical protein